MLAVSVALLSSLPSRLFDEMGVGAAIVLTLLGTVLNLYYPRLQMTAEEQAKDQKLTNDEARRRIRFYHRCSVFVTLLGAVALVLVMLDLLRE